MQTSWNILCNWSKCLNFCQYVWSCCRAPDPARCSAADPTGLAAGLGSPSLRSTRDLGVVPRADSPDSPPGYFWHRVWAPAARSDFIRWCFKYSVLCVSCCVNVNVERFQTQSGASPDSRRACWAHTNSLRHLVGMFETLLRCLAPMLQLPDNK